MYKLTPAALAALKLAPATVATLEEHDHKAASLIRQVDYVKQAVDAMETHYAEVERLEAVTRDVIYMGANNRDVAALLDAETKWEAARVDVITRARALLHQLDEMIAENGD